MVSPIYVAAVGGLAYLAVRMPSVFHRLALHAAKAMTIGGALMATWHLGVAAMSAAMIRRFPDLSAEITSAADSVSMSVPLVFGLLFATLIVVALIYLAHTVDKYGPKRSEADE